MLKLLKNVTSPSQRRTEPEPLMMSVGLGDGSAVPAVARASAAAGAARSREGSTSSHRLDATLAEERRRAMADKDALITLLQQQVQMTSGGAMGFGPGASPTRAAMASPKSASSSAASPRGNSGVTHVPGAALAASAGMATAPGTMQQTPAEEALKRELRLTRMQLAATKEQNLAIGKQLRASQRQMRKATAQSLMISGHASGPGGGDNSGGSGSFKRRTRTPLSHASPHTRTRGLSGSGSRTSFLHRTRSGRGSAMSDKGSCAGSEKGSAKDLDESIGATAVDADDEDELAPLGGMNSKLTSGRLATLDEASGVELLLSKKDKRMFERLIGSSDDDRGTEPGRCRTKRSDTATSLDPEALRNASIPVSLLKKELQLMGLAQTDPRLAAMYEELVDVDTLDFEQFQALKSQFMLVDDALSGELAISNFGAFCDALVDIYHNTTDRRDGDVARYIPALARVEPEQYGVAVCSIHGQRFGVGDVKVPFCVQSSSKPLTYCMATELLGEEKVHRHIGREPSGRNFNDRVLKQPEGVPHNPYINAGAIMAASLVKMEEDEDARFDYVTSVWAKASGGARVGFQNSTFMGERATASRNFCLGWMMLEEGAFDDKLVHSQVTLTKVLESYFMYCSLEIDCEAMAVVASTLANAGACPLTDERVFQPATVKSCLSLMLSCGMYDYSGEFAFTVGLPTKSGVSGVLCIVVPGLCGISTFSPRLDKLGNSVRGIAFCKEFAARFPVHIFDSTLQRAHASLIDDVSRVEGHVAGSARRKSQVGPNAQGGDGGASLILRGSHIGQRRERELDLVQEQLSALWFACASGDVFRVRQLVARGLDLNISDYDKRSALHLASAEGHMEIVLYLLANGAHVFARDRFGCQPVDDARRGGHTEIEDHLRAVENTPVRSSLKRVGSFLGTQPDGAVAGAGKKDKATSLSRGVSFAGMDVKVAAALNRSRADPEAGSDGESRGDDDESSYRSMEFASQSMETLWDSEEILPELIVRFLDIDGKGRECGVTRAELVRALEMLCGFWLGVERGQDDKMSGSASRRHELWQTVSALPESGITATALRDLLRTEKYGAKIRRIGAALRGQLVIPNFPAFYEQIGGIYEEAASLHLKVVKRSALVGNAGGHGSGGTGESEGGDEETEEHDRHDTANLTMKLVLEDGPTFAEGTDAVEAGLIQTQASVRRYRDPQSALNGFALCTTSGQRLALGASQHRFCTDQLCRPFAYAWAQEKLGNEAVRQVVGQEPSGSSAEFDPLNQDGKPYNPMTTAGFMALCAILETHSAPEQRLRTALQLWRDMSGTSQPRLSMSGYEAMRGPDQLDTQTSLLYMLRKMRVVPHDTNMEDTLEFCAMLHAIEVNAESISVLAATLSNGGVCPLTNRRVLQPSTVRNTLSLMHSCGMGDESGAFAFDVGIPAKYARTGAVMLVVPGVLGACYFAPGVNCHHIPVRAKYFFSKFAQLYNFHPYDSLIGGTKIDPRLYDGNEVSQQINKLLGAAQGGDLTEIKHLNFQGVDLNSCDYDRRTAAHLAASEGHLHVLTYFAQQGVDMSVTDRWGSMPIDDARNGEWEDVVEALENWLNPPSAAVGGESEV